MITQKDQLLSARASAVDHGAILSERREHCGGCYADVFHAGWKALLGDYSIIRAWTFYRARSAITGDGWCRKNVAMAELKEVRNQ